jgi:peptide/nickel transport system permease protein
MGAFLVRRFALTLVTLLGITLMTFLVMRMAPGGLTAGATDLSARVSAHEQRKKFVALYDLDKPWYVQYGRWLKRLSRLDFGRSFKDDRPVLEKIGERLPNTLLLNVLSLGLVFFVAVPLGILAAVKQNTFWDRAVSALVFIGFSAPTFWVALMLMMLFGVTFGWLPLSGLHALNADELSGPAYVLDMARHLVLPVLISAFAGLAGLSRFVRNGLLEVVRQDYIRTARAKGVPESRIIYHHALRNALIPVVTLLGLSLPDLIGGGFIFETIFAFPGMGRLGFDAVMARDFPVVMGVGTIAAFLTLAGNLLADVTYALVDPRIRLAGKHR